VLAVLLLRLVLPVVEHRVAACVDFLNVVVHVLNEQNMVVEGFLILGIALALGPHNRGRLLGNDLQALKHGLVDARIGVVNHAPNL
jgi:predicted membrane protein